MTRRTRRLSNLQIALLVSLALHGALLFVRFAAPATFNRIFQDSPLEVILVNSRSGEAPEKAQAIAQANLAGGGEFATGRATSPLPSSALSCCLCRAASPLRKRRWYWRRRRRCPVLLPCSCWRCAG